MEGKTLEAVEYLALKKLRVFRQSIVRYILRAVLASMFIGFGVIVAYEPPPPIASCLRWGFLVDPLEFGSNSGQVARSHSKSFRTSGVYQTNAEASVGWPKRPFSTFDT
jgi:hypothetical protein